MTGARKFQRVLKEFINSNHDFKVIHQTSTSFISQSTRRLCVLDSSFNPPHLGHYHLVEKSLSHDYGSNETQKERSVMLLLSVRNADKTTPTPESFETRLEMMYLMSEYMRKELSVEVSISLSKHAKFVDKSSTILNYLSSNGLESQQIKLTFLVGFDTLVRIFDPKYYLPEKLSTSLGFFLKSTDLFCLTRDDEVITLKEQLRYVTAIRTGEYEHIPSIWSKSIYLSESVGEKIGSISSSALRRKIKEGSYGWRTQLVPEVKEFIVSEKLYKNTEST